MYYAPLPPADGERGKGDPLPPQRNPEMYHEVPTVESTSKALGFLYILMRDHLPPGAVEEIFSEHVDKMEGMTVTYSNGYLAQYAQSLAKRLL